MSIAPLIGLLGDLIKLIEPKETRLKNRIDEILKELEKEIYDENIKDFVVDDLIGELHECIKKLLNSK